MSVIKVITGIVNQELFIPDMPSLMAVFEGKKVELKRIIKKRSNPQNDYYWSTLLPLAADCIGAQDINEMHEAFIHEHLAEPREVRKAGKTIYLMKIRRTKDLNTVEFEEYLSKCRHTILEFCGTVIPKPREVPLY